MCLESQMRFITYDREKSNILIAILEWRKKHNRYCEPIY